MAKNIDNILMKISKFFKKSALKSKALAELEMKLTGNLLKLNNFKTLDDFQENSPSIIYSIEAIL